MKAMKFLVLGLIVGSLMISLALGSQQSITAIRTVGKFCKAHAAAYNTTVKECLENMQHKLTKSLRSHMCPRCFQVVQIFTRPRGLNSIHTYFIF